MALTVLALPQGGSKLLNRILGDAFAVTSESRGPHWRGPGLIAVL